MNKKVENIIIGFGKAGKTLANYLGNKGEKTILVEKLSLIHIYIGYSSRYNQ